VDYAYIGITVAVIARSKDQPIAVVANQANKGTAIIARADSTHPHDHRPQGQEGRKPADLDPRHPAAQLFKQANVKLDEVTLIRLAPADMPARCSAATSTRSRATSPTPAWRCSRLWPRPRLPVRHAIGGINVGVLSSDMHIKDKAAMMRVWAKAHAQATEALMRTRGLGRHGQQGVGLRPRLGPQSRSTTSSWRGAWIPRGSSSSPCSWTGSRTCR